MKARPIKRLFLSRPLHIAVGVYGALWLATYAIGAPQVRRSTVRYMEVPPGAREVSVDVEYLPSVPVYGCSVVAYAPFVLTARYMVWWDGEAAMGGTAIHFWYGVPSRPLVVRDWKV